MAHIRVSHLVIVEYSAYLQYSEYLQYLQHSEYLQYSQDAFSYVTIS